MTKCDLCGTQKGGSYGSIHDIGFVCHRCSIVAMAGPEMVFLPHCPKVPDDIDLEVLQIQMKGMDPLTTDEYDSWVQSCGNPTKGKLKFQEIFAEWKIQKWFEKQGGSVLTQLSPDPITFENFRACAMKHPPSKQHIPGIDEETAKAIIQMFQMLIFVLPHHPDMGEIVDGVLVGNECGNCGKELDTIKRCSRCKKTKYCSKECQRAHWKVHKQKCQPVE